MADVAFKDLCIDVTAGHDGPERVARFWAAALGQPVRRRDGELSLDPPEGGPPARRVWINVVPEPPAGKSRVHLDIRLPDGDPAPLLAAGGMVVRLPDDEVRWTVVDDPDGVPVCVFGPHPADPDGPPGPFELVVDAADPERIATWWAARTGGTVGTRPGAAFAWVEGAAGLPFRFWVFAEVPEPKTVKNRVHWDVTLADATIDDLVAAGATVLRPEDDEIRWWVLADPDGNEFCAFAPRET
jgi:hypothetical protein